MYTTSQTPTTGSPELETVELRLMVGSWREADCCLWGVGEDRGGGAMAGEAMGVEYLGRPCRLSFFLALRTGKVMRLREPGVDSSRVLRAEEEE